MSLLCQAFVAICEYKGRAEDLCEAWHDRGRVTSDGRGWVRDSGVRRRDGRGGSQVFPDASGEVAFEAAQCFFAGFAFGLFAGEVGGGVWIPQTFVNRQAVQSAVELAVAAAV